jgi:hypothetical protein
MLVPSEFALAQGKGFRRKVPASPNFDHTCLYLIKERNKYISFLHNFLNKKKDEIVGLAPTLVNSKYKNFKLEHDAKILPTTKLYCWIFKQAIFSINVWSEITCSQRQTVKFSRKIYMWTLLGFNKQRSLSKFSVMDPMFLYRRDLTNYDQTHIHMWTSLGFNKQRSFS